MVHDGIWNSTHIFKMYKIEVQYRARGFGKYVSFSNNTSWKGTVFMLCYGKAY